LITLSKLKAIIILFQTKWLNKCWQFLGNGEVNDKFDACIIYFSHKFTYCLTTANSTNFLLIMVIIFKSYSIINDNKVNFFHTISLKVCTIDYKTAVRLTMISKINTFPISVPCSVSKQFHSGFILTLFRDRPSRGEGDRGGWECRRKGGRK